ncbi:MAG TPA: tetratricopeptide repeat protein [Rhodothermales bacterium]
MKRNTIVLVLLTGLVLMGASTCSSDPNVEGAKLDLRNQDYDRALENLETALQRNPDNSEALDLKGQVLQEKLATEQNVDAHRALLEEMVQSYRRAMELDAELVENTTQRLRLAYYNEFQRGLTAFNAGRDNTEQYNVAFEYFKNAAFVFPDSSDAYANQAYALLNAGRQSDAITALENAMKAGDDSEDTYVYLGDLYRTQERHDDAITLLQEGLEKYPTNEQLWSILLNEYVATGQLDQAMDRYAQLVQQAPDNKLYRFNYGTLLLNAERFDEAVEQLRRATELDSEYPNAQYNLAAAYVNKAVDLSERIGAIDDSLRAERNQLSDAEIDRREAQIESLAQERQHLFEQAIPPLEKALQLFQDAGESATDVCQTLFTAYVQTQQNDKAESVAECAGYEDIN